MLHFILWEKMKKSRMWWSKKRKWKTKKKRVKISSDFGAEHYFFSFSLLSAFDFLRYKLNKTATGNGCDSSNRNRFCILFAIFVFRLVSFIQTGRSIRSVDGIFSITKISWMEQNQRTKQREKNQKKKIAKKKLRFFFFFESFFSCSYDKFDHLAIFSSLIATKM